MAGGWSVLCNLRVWQCSGVACSAHDR